MSLSEALLCKMLVKRAVSLDIYSFIQFVNDVLMNMIDYFIWIKNGHSQSGMVFPFKGSKEDIKAIIYQWMQHEVTVIDTYTNIHVKFLENDVVFIDRVEIDLKMAKRWYDQAVSNFNEDAKKCLDALNQ